MSTACCVWGPVCVQDLAFVHWTWNKIIHPHLPGVWKHGIPIQGDHNVTLPHLWSVWGHGTCGIYWLKLPRIKVLLYWKRGLKTNKRVKKSDTSLFSRSNAHSAHVIRLIRDMRFLPSWPFTIKCIAHFNCLVTHSAQYLSHHTSLLHYPLRSNVYVLHNQFACNHRQAIPSFTAHRDPNANSAYSIMTAHARQSRRQSMCGWSGWNDIDA